MSKPTEKVEINFSGNTWSDVTQFVQSYSINRGKSRELDRYRAGTSSVVLNNNERTFDPTNTSSPYYGNITPKKKIRLTANNKIQFVGIIDDWNFEFTPNGNNTAIAVATDSLRDLANQVIDARTNSAELTGSRIDTILSLPEISWPLAERNIEAGQQALGADTIAQGTNALTYLQYVEQSEPGSIFIGKNGYFVFKDRSLAATSTIPVLSDSGTGIPYTDIRVVYGTELLYNNIVLINTAIGGTAVASSLDSQNLYGILNLTQSNMLQSNLGNTQDIAEYWSNKYGNPEYRIESLTVFLNELNQTDQDKLLDLELNDVVQIIFTPGNPPVGPAINSFAEVIKLQHRSDVPNYQLTLGFATLQSTFLVLDDPVFGRLDQNALGW